MSGLLLRPAAVIAVAVTALGAQQRIRVASSAELREAVAAAAPGHVIVLAPGRYEPGVRLEGVAGTRERPVVIEGADAGDPPVFTGGGCALHLVGCRHVTLRHLVVRGCTGNGINVDDGGSIDSPARHVVLEDITVLDTGPRGNHDGIKLSGVDDFVVRRCRVAGWGGSAIDMVGCHRGVVEDCVFEGKEGFSQSNGVQMKGGCREVVVQGCFFAGAGQRAINAGGSTGERYFRPRDARFEAEDLTIAGNRFTGSQASIAFVNARGVRVRHNTIHLPEKWVLRILQESRGERFPPCRECVFEHNLVVFDGRLRTHVNVGPGTAPDTFAFRGNAWFAVGGETRRSLPVEEDGGVLGIDPELVEPGTAAMWATAADPRLRAVGARGHRRSR